MNQDATRPEPEAPISDIWRLPRVLELDTRAVRYRRPRTTISNGEIREVREGVEITIRTDGEFPIRALAPVLWVANEAVTESERVGEKQYRFFAYEPARLKTDSVIALGWPNMRQKAVKTRFRYRPSSATNR